MKTNTQNHVFASPVKKLKCRLDTDYRAVYFVSNCI